MLIVLENILTSLYLLTYLRLIIIFLFLFLKYFFNLFLILLNNDNFIFLFDHFSSPFTSVIFNNQLFVSFGYHSWHTDSYLSIRIWFFDQARGKFVYHNRVDIPSCVIQFVCFIFPKVCLEFLLT